MRVNGFDVMVIGSGSGLEISSEAAERGLSVAVVFERKSEAARSVRLLPWPW